jgi:cytochrome d ubiquinol oxidase subunit I
MAISSWYLLKGRDVDFAKRSFRIAAAFGFASVCSVIVLGDESGYVVSESQQTKLAAMEGMWETEPAPAGFNLLAIPNEAEMKNDFAIEIPWVMGIIGTRSLDKQIPGLKDILAKNRARVVAGIEAVRLLEALRQDGSDDATRARFDAVKDDLGFGLLLKKYVVSMDEVTPALIDRAAADTIPRVTPLFWTFRLMVALGFAMLVLFGLALWHSVKGDFAERRWLLRWALWFLPVPWIASELGWFVAEYGRQPWTIFGVLPTHLSVSTLTVESLYGSLAGFVGFYTLLLVVEMYLMVRFARQGPSSLGSGRYHDEQVSPDEPTVPVPAPAAPAAAPQPAPQPAPVA